MQLFGCFSITVPIIAVRLNSISRYLGVPCYVLESTASKLICLVGLLFSSFWQMKATITEQRMLTHNILTRTQKYN
jgi:hypothetical protein